MRQQLQYVHHQVSVSVSYAARRQHQGLLLVRVTGLNSLQTISVSFFLLLLLLYALGLQLSIRERCIAIASIQFLASTCVLATLTHSRCFCLGGTEGTDQNPTFTPEHGPLRNLYHKIRIYTSNEALVLLDCLPQ